MDDIFKNIKLEKYEDINKEEFINKEMFISDALKRNSIFVECPHCGVSGNEPNMLRWHFGNCTTKFRNCEQCNNVIPRQGIKPFLYDVKKYCNRNCYMESKKGKPPIIMTDEIKEKLSEIGLSQSKDRSDRMKITKPWKSRWKKN